MMRFDKQSARGRGMMTAAIAACLMIAATGAEAQVFGSLKDNRGAVYTGRIRYKKTSKIFVITTKSGVVSEVSARNIVAKRIQMPDSLKAAVRKVQAGQHASAIPALESIYNDYELLEHDVTAARYLLECYLEGNRTAEAIKMGEKVLSDNPGGMTAEFFGKFGDALLAGKQTAKLNSMIDKAIASGNREVAAMAQVKRGDLEMAQGRYKEALRDGYLRTVFLFQQIESVQPEALYKAYKCFKEMNQGSHAEKMRKKLKAKYPTSSYAKKLDDSK